MTMAASYSHAEYKDTLRTRAVMSSRSETTGWAISNHMTAKTYRAMSQAQQRSYMDHTILGGEPADVARISKAPLNPQL